jgi:hypothetical protein
VLLYDRELSLGNRGALSTQNPPAASAFQDMHDAADDAAIVRSLDTSHICR